MHRNICRFIIFFLITIFCSWHVLNADQYLKLYLTGEGTPDSQVIQDSSGNNYQITPFGNVKISNSQSKFGKSSIYFGGSGDYLSVPQTADWDFGTGDFTVDFWYQYSGDNCMQGGVQRFIDNGNTFGFSWSLKDTIECRYPSLGLKVCNCDGGPFTSCSFLPWNPRPGCSDLCYGFNLNIWYHIAVVGKGGNQVKVFVNGIQVPSTKNFTYKLSCNKNLQIGPLYGYIDELRVLKGIARWWDNFTPPTGPNKSPTITAITAKTTNEDTPTAAIPFTIGDIETPVANLALVGTSSNTTLVPNANIVFSGSGTNRTLIITPALNQFGTTDITVQVEDEDGGTKSTAFQLSVISINDLPVISPIANQIINEDETSHAIPFTIDDVESAPDNLTLAGTSSNTTLVPNANIGFGGNGANRTVTVTPAANQFGAATITVRVNDANGGSATTPFTLTVTSVNDNPTITPIANQTIGMNGSTAAIPFTIGDVETPVASLTLVGTSSNMTLVPVSGIVFGGNGASRTVTVKPAANQVGTTNITVRVNDANSGSGTTTFLLTVLPPPSIADFTATPATITEGYESTLSFHFSNGTGVIDQGVGAVTSGVTINVHPTVTTPYVLTVTGPAGIAKSGVTVTILDAPPQASLTIQSSTIMLGQSTTLSWTSQHGRVITIMPGVGPVPASGSTIVSPGEIGTTTYTITVTNNTGSDSDSAPVTVTVNPSQQKPGAYYEYDSMGRIKKVIKIIPQ